MKRLYKKYGIYGQVECVTLLSSGGKTLKVHFANGSRTSRGLEPASFVTPDKGEQDIIEESADYKKGVVKLVEQWEEADGEDAHQPEENPEEKEKESAEGVFPGVTNMQGAVAILTDAPYGVGLKELQNKAAVLAKAAELGVTFPDWK